MNVGELLSKIWNHKASGLVQPHIKIKESQHFKILCVSFGLFPYEVTNFLNWIPASIFLVRRSHLLKMMMKAVPARSFELQIDLQSWNESA